jgi:hypothetical protein
MPIPAFCEDGRLPEGIHDCTLTEIRERFGQFHESDHRCRLFERLEAFLRDVAATGLFRAVIVDGSFVTAVSDPNDIDLILVFLSNHDFAAALRPFEYNVVSKREVRRKFGFDIVVVRDGSATVSQSVEFFSRVRGRPGVRKGLLRISL